MTAVDAVDEKTVAALLAQLSGLHAANALTALRAAMARIEPAAPLSASMPLPHDLRTATVTFATELLDSLDDAGMFGGQTARDCTENFYTTLRAFASDIEAAQTDHELLPRLVRTFHGALCRLGAQLRLSQILGTCDELEAIAKLTATRGPQMRVVSYNQVRNGEPYMAFSIPGSAAQWSARASIDEFRRRATTEPITINKHAGMEIVVLREQNRANESLQAAFSHILGMCVAQHDVCSAPPSEDEGPTLFFLAATGEILLKKPCPEQVRHGGGRAYRLPAHEVNEIHFAVEGAMLEEGNGLVYASQVLAWLDAADLDRKLFDEQIIALRAEAREHDDDKLIALCNSALDVAMSDPGESIDARPAVECRWLVAGIIAKRTPTPTTMASG